MILFPLLPGAIHYKNLAPKRIERNWSDLPRYLERPVGRGDDLAHSSSQCPGKERWSNIQRFLQFVFCISGSVILLNFYGFQALLAAPEPDDPQDAVVARQVNLYS